MKFEFFTNTSLVYQCYPPDQYAKEQPVFYFILFFLQFYSVTHCLNFNARIINIPKFSCTKEMFIYPTRIIAREETRGLARILPRESRSLAMRTIKLLVCIINLDYS